VTVPGAEAAFNAAEGCDAGESPIRFVALTVKV
jgi:hypothetical protein